MGQTFQRVGSKDPRINTFDGKVDYRISQQLRSWSKTDAPPRRVRPAPVTLVTYILNAAYNPGRTRSAEDQAYADMICLSFFFLLRPGEYTGTTNDDAAFRLSDVRLSLGTRLLSLEHSSVDELEAATSVSLYFTTQKNQRKGDAIAHARSSHRLCCPVRAAVRRILDHRTHRPYDPTTILAAFYHHGHACRIRADDVTKRLRHAAAACFFSTGIPASEISARALRAGGAMALKCAGVDPCNIQLVGRWHSEAMLQYLHQDCTPIQLRLASRMYNNGTYSFANTWVPDSD